MPVRRLAFSSPGASTGPEDAKRLRRWWDEYSASLGGLEVEADPEMPFPTRIEFVPLGAVGLGRSSGSINRFWRSSEGCKHDGADKFDLVINRAAPPVVGVGRGFETAMDSSSAMLFDCTDQVGLFPPGGHVINQIRLPRSAVTQAVRNWDSRVGTIVRAENDALRLLVNFLDGLFGVAGLSDPAVLDFAGQTLMDLAVLALGADRDNTEVASSRGLRTARLDAVLRLIRAEYSDPEISPERVAARLGISIRYLHKLLHETGASFAERVQQLRLEKAFSLLSGETHAARKIHEAAYDAGFNDLSHFNRVFRRKYGLTPTAARGGGY